MIDIQTDLVLINLETACYRRKEKKAVRRDRSKCRNVRTGKVFRFRRLMENVCVRACWHRAGHKATSALWSDTASLLTSTAASGVRDVMRFDHLREHTCTHTHILVKARCMNDHP